MDLNEFKRNIKQFGAFNAVEDAALRALNLGVFKILKGIKIDAVHPDFLKCDEKYRGLFLNEGMLRRFGERPEYELSNSFLASRPGSREGRRMLRLPQRRCAGRLRVVYE